jgi:hypothetical protein
VTLGTVAQEARLGRKLPSGLVKMANQRKNIRLEVWWRSTKAKCAHSTGEVMTQSDYAWALRENQPQDKVATQMLRIGIPILIAVSIALFVPKKVRAALGILGILGILAALWAIAALVVVLMYVPPPQR